MYQTTTTTNEIARIEGITVKTTSSVKGRRKTKLTGTDLLLEAYDRLAAAEQKIAEQEKTIRQLEDLASTDPLTGLMNRRGFEKFFSQELARINRYASPGGLLIMIDLDFFKTINDTHGHLAGDACLKLAADHLLKSIRILDGAARLGGDEFAVLLTHTDPVKAMVRVDQIRRTLNEMYVEWEGKKLHFGASVGVRAIAGDTQMQMAVAEADAALYTNKQHRRAPRGL